jgi:hypothetical protein
MASWVLKCPNCSSMFFHSEIEDNFRNYFFPQKPKFPEGGQSLARRQCGHTATYPQTDLIYQR